MNTTLNTQVAQRYVNTNSFGTVRVSLVKLPAGIHGGFFESAVILPNGETFVWMRNHVLDYAVDGYEHVLRHVEEFIEYEKDAAAKELAEYYTS